MTVGNGNNAWIGDLIGQGKDLEEYVFGKNSSDRLRSVHVRHYADRDDITIGVHLPSNGKVAKMTVNLSIESADELIEALSEAVMLAVDVRERA